MSSEEQIKITGFSRLMVEKLPIDSHNFIPQPPNYSGIWISKDRHWLIAPTSGRGGYQLVAITQDAGIKMIREFGDTRWMD